MWRGFMDRGLNLLQMFHRARYGQCNGICFIAEHWTRKDLTREKDIDFRSRRDLCQHNGYGAIRNRPDH